MVNSNRMLVAGEGDVTDKCTTPDGFCEVLPTKTLCVPEIACNLVSISNMAKNGTHISFKDNYCSVKNSNTQLVMSAVQISNGIYKINISDNSSKNKASYNNQPAALSATTSTANMFTWHC